MSTWTTRIRVQVDRIGRIGTPSASSCSRHPVFVLGQISEIRNLHSPYALLETTSVFATFRSMTVEEIERFFLVSQGPSLESDRAAPHPIHVLVVSRSRHSGWWRL